MKEIVQELMNLDNILPKGERYVFFNAGLHEIDVHCTSRHFKWQQDNNLTDFSGFSCGEIYRINLSQLVDYISFNFTADLKVFRTTTAGWMRWGNFGFSWDPNQFQGLIQNPYYVEKFNEIAVEVVKNYGNIIIWDVFWLSYARPDNTEVAPDNRISRHIIHPGLSVLDVMIRQLLTIVMWHVCDDV